MAYDTSQRPGESLEAWYKRLATTADKRMQRLEKLSETETYKDVLNWSYRVAQRDIKKWSGENHRRFLTKAPDDPEKLLAKVSDIQKFLEAPTSSKATIDKFTKKGLNTINEKYGDGYEFTSGDLMRLYQRGNAAAWNSKFGSKTAIKVIATIKKMSRSSAYKLKKAIKEGKDVDIDASDAEVADAVKTALKDDSLKINQLY